MVGEWLWLLDYLHCGYGHFQNKTVLLTLLNKCDKFFLQLEEITIVFDKGSNSKDNFAKLDKSQLPYVASLTATYHQDLLEIPLSDYQKVKVNGTEYSCYRTKKKVWDKERTIMITINEKLRQGQLGGLNQALAQKQGDNLCRLRMKNRFTRACHLRDNSGSA